MIKRVMKLGGKRSGLKRKCQKALWPPAPVKEIWIEK
jgi:hypothetical protein